MENAGGLVLVDQHAAHERILFEIMRRRMEEEGVPTQRLLLPITLQVPPKDADWVTTHLALLQRAGIAVEAFGPGTFKIDALPTFLRGDPAQILRDIIDDLRETSGTQTSRMRLGEEMIAKTVCRHAVKANDYLREPELVRLIQDLARVRSPVLLPSRAADDDPDILCGIGKEIWEKSVSGPRPYDRDWTRRDNSSDPPCSSPISMPRVNGLKSCKRPNEVRPQ